MRPLGTQRPERPKSELWHKKYEKCGLSKASDAHAYARATAGTPAMPEKAATRLGVIHLGRFGIPDNSFRRRSRMRRCIDSPHGLGGARSIGADPTDPGTVVVEKARKFHALFGVMIDYKPECQQGGNS
jgi:hypothetical protein